MSKKILIYTEGKSDRNFLGRYLNFLKYCVLFLMQTRKRVKKVMRVLIISLSIFVKNSKKKGLIFQENKFFYSLTIEMMAI